LLETTRPAHITTRAMGPGQRGDTNWKAANLVRQYEKVLDEMRRRGLRSWSVRFADTMDINEFYDRFSKGLRSPSQHGCLRALANPLGRWDWWGPRWSLRMAASLRISAQERRAASPRCRPARTRGGLFLPIIEDRLPRRLPGTIRTLDVRTDQNIELVATLLEDARSDRDNACPSSLVLPPGRSKTVCGGSIRAGP